ncbi:unnamed protein product, partial [Gadus morhua 'NCC']
MSGPHMFSKGSHYSTLWSITDIYLPKTVSAVCSLAASLLRQRIQGRQSGAAEERQSRPAVRTEQTGD